MAIQTEGIDSGGDLETDLDEWRLFPYIHNTTAYEYVKVIFLKTIVVYTENCKYDIDYQYYLLLKKN